MTRDQLWESLRLHARLPVFHRHVEAARAQVRRALAVGPCVVATSGGKDSTALLHVARSVDTAITGYWIDSGCETDWTVATIAALQARYPVETIQPRWSLPEMVQMVGGLGYQGPKRLEGDWHWLPADYRRVQIDEPAAAMQRRIEARTGRAPAVTLLGLRREESRARSINAKAHGVLYQRADETWIATPIATWSGRDVLAYFLQHDLPISPVYLQDEPDLEARTRRRTDAALWAHGVDTGKWARLRQEHPRLWQQLTSLFPAMRSEG